jgi:HSP20 family molecular chaperone IbpA
MTSGALTGCLTISSTIHSSADGLNTPVRADIRETENEWLIDAELPGVDKKDIQIDLNDGLLTISVEQKKEVKRRKRKLYTS